MRFTAGWGEQLEGLVTRLPGPHPLLEGRFTPNVTIRVYVKPFTGEFFRRPDEVEEL